MRYFFIMTLFIGVSLMGRDNPFEPMKTSSTTSKAIYKKDTRKSFTSAKIQLPSTARMLEGVEFHFQNLDGSLESKTIKLGQKIDWHDELVVKKLADSAPHETVARATKKEIKANKKINFKNIVEFEIDGKSIHVNTKDIKIRDFLVIKPYKIVVDFKREASFYTKVYDLKTKYFSSITLGKHDGYYRVAIELDGKYLYTKEKTKDGYQFTLK